MIKQIKVPVKHLTNLKTKAKHFRLLIYLRHIRDINILKFIIVLIILLLLCNIFLP